MKPVNIYEAKTRFSQLVDKAAAGEDVRPKVVEAGCEIGTLFVQHGETGLVALLVFRGGAVKLLAGVEDLEGEDGEAVDDEAGKDSREETE